MADRKRSVKEELSEYHILIKKIKLLQFELGQIQPSSENIPLAEFSGSANAMVALPGDAAIGDGTRTRLQAQLSQLLAAINRLEYYVGLLEEDAAMLIRAKYFEQRSWPDMVKHFGRPRSTLYDCVATGLDALSRMFDYADDFSAEEI